MPNPPPNNNALSPEAIRRFTAGLAGLSAEEISKAKLLYLRNAISEYRALETTIASFPMPTGCLSVLPGFGSVIKLQQRIMDTQLKLARDRIVNTIDVWRDDLEAAGFDVDKFDLNG